MVTPDSPRVSRESQEDRKIPSTDCQAASLWAEELRNGTLGVFLTLEIHSLSYSPAQSFVTPARSCLEYLAKLQVQCEENRSSAKDFSVR